MVIERAEVNLLKSVHYYQKQNLQMMPYLFNKYQNNKWETCEIWLKLRMHKDIAIFKLSRNMDSLCCHVRKVSISFSKRNFSHFKGVTTHYQTLQKFLGLNVTRYHNLDVLLRAYHMRYHIFYLGFSWFWAICNALPRVTILF